MARWSACAMVGPRRASPAYVELRTAARRSPHTLDDFCEEGGVAVLAPRRDLRGCKRKAMAVAIAVHRSILKGACALCPDNHAIFFGVIMPRRIVN